VTFPCLFLATASAHCHRLGSWSPASGWAQGQPWSCFQNSKPDSLLKMEEEQKLEKSPLAGNKDKFSFSFSNKKLLGYVRAWVTGQPCRHPTLHSCPPHHARTPRHTYTNIACILHHTVIPHHTQTCYCTIYPPNTPHRDMHMLTSHTHKPHIHQDIPYCTHSVHTHTHTHTHRAQTHHTVHTHSLWLTYPGWTFPLPASDLTHCISVCAIPLSGPRPQGSRVSVSTVLHVQSGLERQVGWEGAACSE
jgi:hypothetical protein